MKNIKSKITKMSAAVLLGTLGVVAANQTNEQPTVEAATEAGGVITVNYVPDYGIALWSSPNADRVATGQYIAHGTHWKVIKTAVGEDGQTWYDLGNGDWIPAQYTKDGYAQVAQSSTSKINAVINSAKAQIGKPYAWGGKTPAGFDCSGLMYYVFNQAAGVNIGGWTVPQESAGRQVSTSELQAGDLVFWGSKGSTYHVGLYIGNGQYIHAPQPGQSVTTATISGYFAPSFGVRVF